MSERPDQDRPYQGRPDWKTWPNLITCFRFLLIPVFVILVVTGHPGWALVSLVGLGVTDWADGFLARRLHQESKLGKALDPIADRMSIVAIVLSLVLVGLLPVWVVAVVVLVDLVLVGLSSVLFRGNPDLNVSWTGKVRSALLYAGLPILLFSSVHVIHADAPWVRVFALVLVYLGTIGHVLAGAQYAAAMFRKRRVAA
jgi:cardiolipin synthase